ncbi:MAG: hypothetical protein PUE59_07650 [Treponema sp.]|nr:hypothetical protein [Treponema sp.]MDD6654878.1 hypothetical protein [Treponema sp.]
MKSLVKIVLFLLALLFFSACSLIPEKKGEILVVNNSEEDLIYSVYGKLENESSYMLYCVNSNAKEKQDVYFYVEPGKYNLEVVVAKKLTDGLYSQRNFRTPYKQPVVVKEKEISIIYYDGNGIYQN